MPSEPTSSVREVAGTADLLYCATQPVGPIETQSMLAGEFQAIWAPPMHRWTLAEAGDRVWLLWRESTGADPLLLGGGVVRSTGEGKIDWTNRTAPGIRDAARAAGFPGPTNMAFLRLDRVEVARERPTVSRLGRVRVGLSAATAEQAATLDSILPILLDDRRKGY
jgi:hypothetical protein